jgi:hypothetical protein
MLNLLMNCFQVIISLGKSVEEQRAEQQAFIITEGREKRLGQEVKSSTKELTALLAEKTKTIKIRDDQIQQYTSEMKDLESAKRMATEQSKNVSENKVLVEQHNEAKASLLKVTKAKTEEFEKLKISNVEKEEAQRKRSFKRETDVETWVLKYDGELGQLQADYNEAQSSYIAEKARMREIEDHFDRYRWEECGKLLMQCEKDADAVRSFTRSWPSFVVALLPLLQFSAICAYVVCAFLTLAQAQADAISRRTGDTASLIQACIRSHLLRKELRDKANKKGKGKGKGKK